MKMSLSESVASTDAFHKTGVSTNVHSSVVLAHAVLENSRAVLSSSEEKKRFVFLINFFIIS